MPNPIYLLFSWCPKDDGTDHEPESKEVDSMFKNQGYTTDVISIKGILNSAAKQWLQSQMTYLGRLAWSSPPSAQLVHR